MLRLRFGDVVELVMMHVGTIFDLGGHEILGALQEAHHISVTVASISKVPNNIPRVRQHESGPPQVWHTLHR